MSGSDKTRLEHQLDQLQGRLPPRFRPWLAWLRSPGARWARIPLGLLLIVGGVASLLPVLGLWMLPLGLLLLALDVPLLQSPTARLIDWLGALWARWRGRR